MQGLMLHTGARSVTREVLTESANRMPDRTETHVPLAHHHLLRQVADTLTRSGLEIAEEAHGLSPDAQRYFGLLGIRSINSPDTDFQLTVGIRNSHDKTFPAALALGARVFVCDNLSFSGEVKIARKHTVNVYRDMPRLVVQAVEQLDHQRGKQTQRIECYKNSNLTTMDVHDFLIRALDARVIPTTLLSKVLHEWRSPSHPEFRDMTAWSLFNAFTEALKGNLNELPRRTQALHGLLDLQCGIAV